MGFLKYYPIKKTYSHPVEGVSHPPLQVRMLRLKEGKGLA